MATKRVVDVKVLPGEPLDGSGRVCIHLFVQDERGPFTEPHALYMHSGEDGQSRLASKPTRGRLTCDPKRTVAPVTRGGVTTITMRTDDARAVTCPKCVASKDYTRMMAILEPSTKRGDLLPQDS